MQLREKKKARTREAILDVATKLFVEKGYDATTMDEIAAAAEVAPRTLFRYFPRKEDLIFIDQDLEDAALAGELARRVPGENEIDFMMRAVNVALTNSINNAPYIERLFPLIMKTPSLLSRAYEVMTRAENIVIAGLTPKRASHAEQLRIKALAAAAIGAFRAVMTDWIERGMKGDPTPLVAEVARMLREGFGKI